MEPQCFLDSCGGSLLWRARCYDAICRRPVCLSPRGILPVARISLWLDAVSRHSDGHYRGRGRRLRALLRAAVSTRFGVNLPCATASLVWRLCDLSLTGSVPRDCYHRGSYMDQLFGPA